MQFLRLNRPGASARRVVIVVLAGFWIVAFTYGMRAMLRFERTPGQIASAPTHWPIGVPEWGSAQLPTLVVALHPRCSCSRASLDELEQAAQTFGASYNAVLLIYQPAGGDIDWRNNALYRDAQTSLHANVVLDTNGLLAQSFGAETSGEVMLYSGQDHSGIRNLLYAGGVTGARGVDGANPGVDSLLSAFHQQRSSAGKPVFGCALTSFLKER